jgi:hypothetical protein
MNTTDVAALFGNTTGYKASEPNVTVTSESTEEEDDF